MKRALYQPDSLRGDTTSTDLFEFLRIPLLIGSGDVGKPLQFPQISGYGFVVDKMDAPCSVILNSKAGGRMQQTVPLRNGLVFKGKFNGLTVLTSPVNGVAGSVSYLDLDILRSDSVDILPAETSCFTNQMNGAMLTPTNSGLQITTLVFVPHSAREIVKFVVYAEGTTVTNCLIQMGVLPAPNPSLFIPDPIAGISDDKTTANYNADMQGYMFARDQVVTSPFGTAQAKMFTVDCPFLVNSQCNCISVTVNGTGLRANTGGAGYLSQAFHVRTVFK